MSNLKGSILFSNSKQVNNLSFSKVSEINLKDKQISRN